MRHTNGIQLEGCCPSQVPGGLDAMLPAKSLAVIPLMCLCTAVTLCPTPTYMYLPSLGKNSVSVTQHPNVQSDCDAAATQGRKQHRPQPQPQVWAAQEVSYQGLLEMLSHMPPRPAFWDAYLHRQSQHTQSPMCLSGAPLPGLTPCAHFLSLSLVAH